MEDELDVRAILVEYGEMFTGRSCLFASANTNVLLSGYVDCQKLFPYPNLMRQLAEPLIDPFLGNLRGVEAFVSASAGDIALLEAAAHAALELGFETTAVWADKQERGYAMVHKGFAQAIRGKRVVVLNSSILTDEITAGLIQAVRACDGEVIGVATIAGNSDITPESLGVEQVHMLCRMGIEALQLSEVPESWEKLPIALDVAHGEQFRRKYGDWPGGYRRLLS